MDYRSPLENIISILPQGHDKPVKHAISNALALLFLFLGCAATIALYLILEPFIKPLMWALMVGSVLHPLKFRLSQGFRSWFENLEERRRPIVIALLLIPINIVDNFSELIGNKLMKYWKIITFVIIIVPVTHVVYYYTPKFIINVCLNLGHYSSNLLLFLINNSSTTLILPLFLGYLSAMVFLWTPKKNFWFHTASLLMWFLFMCYISNQCGVLKLPVFVFLIFISLCGFVLEFRDMQQEMENNTDTKVSLMRNVKTVFQISDQPIEEQKSLSKTSELSPKYETESAGDACVKNEGSDTIEELDVTRVEKEQLCTPLKKKDPFSMDLFNVRSCDQKEKRTGILITDKGNIHVIREPAGDHYGNTSVPPKVQRSVSQPHIPSSNIQDTYFLPSAKRMNSFLQIDNLEQSSSDFYLYSVMWACIIMLFWKNLFLLPILPIPIIIYIVKRLGTYLSVWCWCSTYWEKLTNAIYEWCVTRQNALISPHVRGLYKLTRSINARWKQIVKESIDTVSSCVVIFGLIIFVVCASVFIVFQIYAEGIMLIQMSSNVINQTVVHNPELRQLLPPSFDDTMDSLLDNAYQYGREGISKVVKSIMSDVDPSKSEKFERQVLELWDRVYQAWMASDGQHGPKVTTEAVHHSWNNFVDDIAKSPELFNISGVIAFLKQNIGTLMSLLESVWVIVKGNIGLLLGSFSAFMSVLLGGGTAVLNFLLNTIIFLTTLFYLLASSGRLYKPVQILSNFSSNTSRFGIAFGIATNGVFLASFKMATFYGMWTWFIHNLFGVNIVYIPTVLAAVLAAAPFLGTYWACLPAILDLWLAQGKPIYAVLIALFQFLPTSLVDTIIYSEIKGGHPYLTGLAIAGGIFCLGLEGAIIGPLILCGLYVAVDLSSNIFKESPSEESIKLQHISRLELRDS